MTSSFSLVDINDYKGQSLLYTASTKLSLPFAIAWGARSVRHLPTGQIIKEYGPLIRAVCIAISILSFPVTLPAFLLKLAITDRHSIKKLSPEKPQREHITSTESSLSSSVAHIKKRKLPLSEKPKKKCAAPIDSSSLPVSANLEKQFGTLSEALLAALQDNASSEEMQSVKDQITKLNPLVTKSKILSSFKSVLSEIKKNTGKTMKKVKQGGLNCSKLRLALIRLRALLTGQR